MSKVMGIIISGIITIGAILGVVFFSVSKRRSKI